MPSRKINNVMIENSTRKVVILTVLITVFCVGIVSLILNSYNQGIKKENNSRNDWVVTSTDKVDEDQGKVNQQILKNEEFHPTSTQTTAPSISIEKQYIPMDKNKGLVVLSRAGCDYYIVETNLGYSLLEWFGGFLQSDGDVIFGNLNNFGFKDINSNSGIIGKVWVDDYMLSESSAIERYNDKCN